MGYRIAAVLCMQVILVGFVLAEDAYITESTIKGLVFNMEQNVDGNGFSNCYLNASALNLSLSNKAHGSGSYNYESILEISNGAKYDDTKDEYKSSSERTIAFQEDADFSYAPTNFYMGRSMKSRGFESLGSEKTCLKNYGTFVSMDAAFDHVNTLSKNVSASLLWKLTRSSDPYNRTAEKHGKTNLDVVAAFSGKGHIGAFQPGDDLDDPDILIDEDYLGAYQIYKNMTHDVAYKLDQGVDDWLPCCYGGFASMNPLDARAFKSSKGVFDCTCFQVPKSA